MERIQMGDVFQVKQGRDGDSCSGEGRQGCAWDSELCTEQLWRRQSRLS